MTDRDDGGPAFPTRDIEGARLMGLSKREWFAGLAMQGMLVAGEYPENQIARAAYEMADAMLAEGRKGEQNGLAE